MGDRFGADRILRRAAVPAFFAISTGQSTHGKATYPHQQTKDSRVVAQMVSKKKAGCISFLLLVGGLMEVYLGSGIVGGFLLWGVLTFVTGICGWRFFLRFNELGSLEMRTVPQPEVREVPAAESIEPAELSAEEPARTETVSVLRGCQVVGGGFEYKVKVKNNTDFVINNVTVLVVAYPQDCMELTESKLKTVSRIEPNGFRSLQFVFTPTKDCVEGQIIASVSYIDHKNQLLTDQAEPYVIRSVCDLMKPLEVTVQQFEEILTDMKSASEAHTLSWNAPVLFEKTKALLPSRNFHVIEAKGASIGGQFSGTIRGFAKGKYTGKRVAVQLLISGPDDGKEAKVMMEALGDDLAMLPTTIDEVSRGIKSWTCMTCGGIISPTEVTKLKAGEPLKCRYCQHTNTIDLYRK